MYPRPPNQHESSGIFDTNSMPVEALIQLPPEQFLQNFVITALLRKHA
jgi:hypothetical protein